MLYPKHNQCRDLINLSGFWNFSKDEEQVGERENWASDMPNKRDIAVPGSWNEQYSDLFQYMGKAWYQKEVFLGKEWTDKEVWLRIGSIFYRGKVWINGVLVGEHEGAHLPFEFKVTDYINLGEKNLLTIMVDGTLDPWGLPPATLADGTEARIGFFNSNPAVNYDFYPYAGIHRPVYFYTSSQNRIEDITIKTDVDANKGIVKYCVRMTEAFTGLAKVSTDNQEQVIAVVDSKFIEGVIEIEGAKLWDIGCPNLYDLDVEVSEVDSNKTEKLMDQYSQYYGIRTVEVKGNSFLLNGKEVFFKGFGKHEDFYASGKGLNHCLMVKDFDLLKWIGANSFRTSHYPYAEEMMDYADRKGILVIDETPFVGLNERMYIPEVLDKAKKIINELIARDKNHPSVVMWSLANEPNVTTDEGQHFFTEMAKTARGADDTRPITYVAHMEPDNNRGMEHYDVVCINKYYGWYIGIGDIDGTLPEFGACMDRFYEAFKKPMIVAEFGADAIAGMHTEPAQTFSEEYQAEIIEKQYKMIKSKDYSIGAHVWAFADFKTAQSISRIIFNRKGVFTRERTPKMAAHRIKELWR